MPSPDADLGLPGWAGNPAFSQLWNEQSFIHCLRMVAMGIDNLYQGTVNEVCSFLCKVLFVKIPNLCILSDVVTFLALLISGQVCTRSKGEFKKTAIKGYVRMKNKMLSKEDHYHEAYPRLVVEEIDDAVQPHAIIRLFLFASGFSALC